MDFGFFQDRADEVGHLLHRAAFRGLRKVFQPVPDHARSLSQPAPYVLSFQSLLLLEGGLLQIDHLPEQVFLLTVHAPCRQRQMWSVVLLGTGVVVRLHASIADHLLLHAKVPHLRCQSLFLKHRAPDASVAWLWDRRHRAAIVDKVWVDERLGPVRVHPAATNSEFFAQPVAVIIIVVIITTVAAVRVAASWSR